MKLLLIASFAILASANAGFISDALSRSKTPIEYTLYTRANRFTPQTLVLNDASSVANSNFLSSRHTHVVTHGWSGDEDAVSVTSIRDAYLNNVDVNVIVVDWSGIQQIISNPYEIAREGGAAIAEFINFLQSAAELDLTRTTLIGHSLGAHIFAVAARLAEGTVQNLLALDPAGGLLWENVFVGVNLGLQKTDAAYVQVIHTNGGQAGLRRAAGHADFYPNGGEKQPGCTIDIGGICSHYRAVAYFAESITNQLGFRSDQDSMITMGGRTLVTYARGIFTLTTNNASPFARGLVQNS